MWGPQAVPKEGRGHKAGGRRAQLVLLSMRGPPSTRQNLCKKDQSPNCSGMVGWGHGGAWAGFQLGGQAGCRAGSVVCLLFDVLNGNRQLWTGGLVRHGRVHMLFLHTYGDDLIRNGLR